MGIQLCGCNNSPEGGNEVNAVNKKYNIILNIFLNHLFQLDYKQESREDLLAKSDKKPKICYSPDRYSNTNITSKSNSVLSPNTEQNIKQITQKNQANKIITTYRNYQQRKNNNVSKNILLISLFIIIK